MNRKKTILIVDDTETNIDILLEILDDEYDILVSLDGRGALEIVEEESVDLILLDIMMPEMDGYEVASILKSQESTKDIPVVFITAKTDEDSIEKAYESGGIDYITKPFKPRELTARVRTQIKLKNLMDHLEYIASYDSMTGIYNRRKFFELAEKEFTEKAENLFVVMIDIDKFKDVNDKYGHPLGDKVIKAVTGVISKEVSKSSIFGRIGGEEFAIVCHAPSRESILERLEKIRLAVSNLEIKSEDGALVKCTISEGFSENNPSVKNLDNLLKDADIALYEAKGTGRNKVIFR
jgi:diguanylate cyclase (GGDEF)-like protein